MVFQGWTSEVAVFRGETFPHLPIVPFSQGSALTPITVRRLDSRLGFRLYRPQLLALVREQDRDYPNAIQRQPDPDANEGERRARRDRQLELLHLVLL